jgi:hypothetical protein
MPSPSAVFSELVATTFRNHRKTIVDSVSKNNALLSRLNEKGMTRSLSGGLTIATTLDYANNSTYQRYSGYDVLNIAASDVITAAEFQWRQIAVNVVASGLEMRVNSGESQISDLVKARMKNATRTFKNNFSSDVYSDGTLPNQIGGLQVLVADTGGGTVGGIDSNAWPFWQSKVQSAAAPIQGGGAVVVSSTTIESLWLQLWLELVRGDDKPDLIVCDNNYFSLYEQSQVAIKRYTDSKQVSGGFTSLKYKNADVIFDGGSGIPSNRAYFLNTDYLRLCTHKDANMTVMSDMTPINQDAVVVPVLWMGNMEVTNRARQGVMKP